MKAEADQDALRLHGCDDSRGGLRIHLAVEWHHDGTELPARPEIDGCSPVIQQPEDNPVARADAARRQVGGDAVNQAEKLLAVDRPPDQPLLTTDRDGTRVARSPLPKQVVEMGLHKPLPIPHQGDTGQETASE
jgi:hypothetical protein